MRPALHTMLLLLCLAPAVSACRPETQSPLARAVVLGRAEEVATLLAGGASPNERTARGLTALGLAARNGQVAVVEQLIRAGADPDIRDANENQWTPLLNATHTHQLVSVDALLRLGADPDLGSGLTPLMMAAGSGDDRIVKRLLDGGADPYIKMKSGENALGAAVSGAPDLDEWTVGKCHTTTVKLLLDRAPDLRLEMIWSARPVMWLARFRDCAEVMRMVSGRHSEGFLVKDNRPGAPR